MTNPKVQIKKVKAYPFPATIKIGTATVPGQIVKLTVQGFLIEFNLKTIQPGDKFEVWFEIPVKHQAVTEPCVVVKLYNTWKDVQPGSMTPNAPSTEVKPSAPAAAGTPPAEVTKMGQMMEAHFLGLKYEHKEKIVSFLNAIGRAGLR